jgi:hypothetical protein
VVYALFLRFPYIVTDSGSDNVFLGLNVLIDLFPRGKSAREAHLVTNTLQKHVLQLGKNNGASLSERAPWRGAWGVGETELIHWGPGKIFKEKLLIQASLSIGAPLQLREPGIWKGGFIYWGI